MTRKQALGRGLSALLPGPKEAPRVFSGAQEVEIARLVPGRFQPRHGGSEKSLAELADSIRQHGIVQPIVVSPHGEKLEILAGERRWRAASLAGLGTVPVIYRDSTDQDRLEVALVENLQREDLNPLDAAEAYARLREEFHLSQDQIAQRVGKDRTTVANAIRLLKLPASVREKIREGTLSAGHARALAALVSADDQERLAALWARRRRDRERVVDAVAPLAADPVTPEPASARRDHDRQVRHSVLLP